MAGTKTHTGHYIDLFLDSGAFGAWKRGIELPLKDYIDFIKRNQDYIWEYVSMDSIPGSKGKVIHTTEAKEKSAKLSYENHQRMKDAGLTPIPVFHMGEQWKWLERMLEEGEPYVGLSPNRKVHQSLIRKWLDNCFHYLVDKQGRPLVKTHAFGLTNATLLLRYPWHTADSTSWVVNYGDILVPACVDGKADFTKPPISIEVTGVKPRGRQFAGLGPIMRQWVEDYLASHGLTIADVRVDISSRRRLHVLFLKQVEAINQGGIFKGLQGARLKSPLYFPEQETQDFDFNVVPVGYITGYTENAMLNRSNVRTRLIPYFDFIGRKNGDKDLRKYVEKGIIATKPGRPPSKPNWNNIIYINYRRRALIRKIEDNANGHSEEATTGGSGAGGASPVVKQHDPGDDTLLVHRRKDHGVQRPDSD